MTDAEGGSWYPDDDLVFGIVIGRQARAYPKNVMEVHEMVNDTLGGRNIAIPYCTLCLSAQAYFTDDVEGFRPLLRTSGLLSRSNKFMYDITTFSAVDTFTGEAISGPLFDAGVRLNQTTVVTSTWAAWRTAHPDTTIIAEDGGIGRSYPRNPLRGRDDAGPIFPVGDVDPRLGVHDVVLGVVATDGTPVAFPVGAARLALEAGEEVAIAGVALQPDAGGLRAFIDGAENPAHESVLVCVESVSTANTVVGAIKRQVCGTWGHGRGCAESYSWRTRFLDWLDDQPRGWRHQGRLLTSSDGSMNRFLTHWLVTALALGAAAWILPGVMVTSLPALLVAALALGLINAVVKPVLVVLTLPITIVTLGLFYLVVNGTAFALAAMSAKREL